MTEEKEKMAIRTGKSIKRSPLVIWNAFKVTQKDKVLYIPKTLKELEEAIPKFVTIISEKSKRRCWKTGKERDLNIQDEGRGGTWRNSAQLNRRILAKILEHCFCMHAL